MAVHPRTFPAFFSERLGLRWALREPARFHERRAPRIVHEVFAQDFFGELWREFMPDEEFGGVDGADDVPAQYRLEERVYAELQRRAALLGEPMNQCFNTVLLAGLEKRGFVLFRAIAVASLAPLGVALAGLASLAIIIIERPSDNLGSIVVLTLFAVAMASLGLQAVGRRAKHDLPKSSNLPTQAHDSGR